MRLSCGGRLLPLLASSSTTKPALLLAARAPTAAAAAASTSSLAATKAVVAPPRSSYSLAAGATITAAAPSPRPAGPHRRRAATTMAASSSAPAPSSVDWASLGFAGPLAPAPGEDVAVLGGGCFWCIEAAFNGMKGVSRALSGYAGGHVESPTYEEICDKKTGHAEVVGVYYDPGVVSFEQILNVFYALHDPTTPNQQGNDVGPQYRSAIYTIGDAQRAAAEKVMREVAEAKIWGDKPLTTELAPLQAGPKKFWVAEDYHQRYAERVPGNPYCQFVVAPKVSKFRSKFAHLLK
jgi:peptide-methionine (S)-S-oxide reductase